MKVTIEQILLVCDREHALSHCFAEIFNHVNVIIKNCIGIENDESELYFESILPEFIVITFNYTTYIKIMFLSNLKCFYHENLFKFLVHVSRNVDSYINKKRLNRFINEELQRFQYVKDYSKTFSEIVRLIKILPFIPPSFVMVTGY